MDPERVGSPENAAIFVGNALPEGADPLAQAYAGHQYGNFTFLGDGRAILLGEQRTPTGERHDIQLKGAGPTPYSRRGDGRAALGPMLREYLISEAMFALGIPTTRSLAVTATGEPVFREEPLPGAVLTRVASSHLRVGTFEWAAARGDREALAALAEHAVERHYPEAAGAGQPYVALLEAVVDRQAALVARWQCVGFVHGVMNTDNMALSGETIDYGPCAFMDAYDPATVFSSIDRHGRYAYGNQPRIAQWNLARLAEALLPVLDPDPQRALAEAQRVIEGYTGKYERAWLTGMRSKLGLFDAEPGDEELVGDLLRWMQRRGADFTRTFRGLSSGEREGEAGEDADFMAWRLRWRARLARQARDPRAVAALMKRNNPAVIPRNHRVEDALDAATRRGDLGAFLGLLEVLAQPYADEAESTDLAEVPPAGGDRYRTFCGT